MNKDIKANPDTASISPLPLIDLFGNERIKAELIVSRETETKLQAYADILTEWAQKFNLIAPSTIPLMATRHFLDSAQLYQFLPKNTETLADMGSGAGFPGLVLSIMGVPKVHLIESTGKKARFLEYVAKTLGLNVEIHQERIEKLRGLKADVITARALTSMPLLLSYAKPLLNEGGFCLFLKGLQSEAELTDARKYWTFDCTRFPSTTDPSGVILKIGDIRIVKKHDQARRNNSPSRKAL